MNGPVWTTAGTAATWWTWEGTAANRGYTAALGPALGDELAPQAGMTRPESVLLHPGVPVAAATERLEFWNALPEDERPLPDVHPALIKKLKFSEALPVEWAQEVVARRMVQ